MSSDAETKYTHKKKKKKNIFVSAICVGSKGPGMETHTWSVTDLL